jgi:tRNA-splicing ligase RtcB
MKKVINSEKNLIKLWLDDIEEGALLQTKNLANLPFVYKWIAIMPDSHQGYGMPIGGVLATQGVVIPNAVGVDIGCGMGVVKTSLTEITTDQLKKIMGIIRKTVPVGMKHHDVKQNVEYDEFNNSHHMTKIVEAQLEKGLFQLGTLGGGNHFIEIQKGSDGHIWIMIHSGSRNVGYQTANHYQKLADKINQKYFTSVPLEWDLSFLPINSLEGHDYIADMSFCIDFAYHNRRLMLDRVQEAFREVIGDIEFEPEINKPHNFAAMENHFNNNVMVHRKGATRAYEGEIGMIPGSQGTASYIVKGKGNVESFKSCSHGAGRKMGRNVARKTLSLEDEQKKLDDLGIVHSIRNIADLDEAPSAYKDISVVMENQKDLVDIVVELKPLAVIKSSDGGVD